MENPVCVCGHEKDRHVLPNVDGEICVNKYCHCKEFRPTPRAADVACTCDVLSVMGGVMLGYKKDCPVPSHAANANRWAAQRSKGKEWQKKFQTMKR